MNTRDASMGAVAVNIATNGENTNINKIRFKVDWNEFGHFIGIWIVTWLILFFALIIITIAKCKSNLNEADLIFDTIKTIDMLNMSFSLVLSAMLEQIWSKESTRNSFYKIMLGCEVFLTILGGMLYVAYSIVDSKNQLLQQSFQINLGYVIASSIVVTLGFLSRSLVKKYGR